MPPSLVRTKFYIPPPRPNLVPRPQLMERLNAGLHRKLTLLSAPAGFGKTTLLNDWVQKRSESRDWRLGGSQTRQSPTSNLQSPQVAWVSLDEGENDPARFLAYFISAVQTVLDDVGETALMMLQSPQPPSIESLLTDLINEITERLALPSTKSGRDVAQDFVLILDDYHIITAQPVHDALIFLLDHLPPPMHLFIATRADPPLHLPRLRALGQLNELRAGDLRFSPEEAATFLNDMMGLGLSAEEIATLDARTEGWITGLQMAALSMQGREDVTAFISAFSGSHRFVLDYLVEEVLDRQPDDVREFLLKTSILKRVNAPLCDAVLETEDRRLAIGDRQSLISNRQSLSPSQEMLKHLEQANLFVIPLDDERCWYRYHHLFADLLHNQLALAHPDQTPGLHQRASGWFEGEGLIEETISHAFAARDDALVARLIEKYARTMLHQSKYILLHSWIEALPQELVQTRPWLCVYQAWTRHWTGTRGGGEECLDAAEQALNSPPPSNVPNDQSGERPSISEEDKRLIPGHIAAVRAHYALTDEDIPRVFEQARQAMQLLPEDDYFTRGVTGIALGGAYWGMGDVTGAEQAFAECATNALKGGYRFRASSALCYVGMQQVKQARLREAEVTFREALALSQGPGGRRFPNAGYPLVKLGELACEWNDLPAARRDVDDGVKLCTQLGHVDLLAEAYAALARVQLAQQDLAGAQDTIGRIDRLQQETKVDPWIVCWLDECRLRLWFATGELEAAVRWAEKSGLTVDDELSHHYDLHHINLARLLVIQGQRQPSGPFLDQALGLLVRLQEAAESAGWITKTIQILVLRALAHQARGDSDRALAALAPALTLAGTEGYVRIFIGEGAPMGDLLRQAVARGVGADYASRLLTAFLLEDPEIRVQGSRFKVEDQAVRRSDLDPSTLNDQPAPLVEPLSERELQVLRLLATSLTTPEIADQLFVAVSTVRTHVKNIYGKLNVHRRREAVFRARELDLL